MTANLARERRMMDSTGWKIAGWLVDLLVVIIVGVLTFQGKQLYQIKTDLAVFGVTQASTLSSLALLQDSQKDLVTEIGKLKTWQAATSANMFTIQDGYDMQKQFSELKTFVAKIPLEVPPAWFEDKVNAVECQVQKLGDSYADHLIKLHKDQRP